MKTEILNQLKKCDTLQQMLNVLSENYDLNNKLGAMQKGMILTGVDKLIQVAQLKEK